MKKVFVVIVTYKGKQWYDKCFTSLRESAMPVETIVVDNSPTDEDAEYIKTHYPEIHLIKTKENLGFGKANNLGMRYALDHGGDYVFLLNQDTWIDPDAIEKLVAIAEKHPEYGIVSPMQMNAKKDGLFMLIGVQQDNIRLISDLYTKHVKEIYETNYVNAAAWLIPRKVLMEVGGFTPIFQQYAEDDDYINRVLYHQYKIGVCPNIEIVHDHQVSFSGAVYKKNVNSHKAFAEWLDINKQFSPWRLYKLFVRRWIKGLILGDSESRLYYAYLIRLLNQRQGEVLKMRKENMQKQCSWL